MSQAPEKDQDAALRATAQSSHRQAAEHHQCASKCHEEAANQLESGDHKAAEHHALRAHAHAVHAADQGREAVKKYAGAPATRK